jgi:hypothetical protein
MRMYINYLGPDRRRSYRRARQVIRLAFIAPSSGGTRTPQTIDGGRTDGRPRPPVSALVRQPIKALSPLLARSSGPLMMTTLGNNAFGGAYSPALDLRHRCPGCICPTNASLRPASELLTRVHMTNVLSMWRRRQCAPAAAPAQQLQFAALISLQLDFAGIKFMKREELDKWITSITQTQVSPARTSDCCGDG